MVMDGYPPWTDPKLRRRTQQIAGSIDIGLHFKPNRTEVGVSGDRQGEETRLACLASGERRRNASASRIGYLLSSDVGVHIAYVLVN
jgi:hypothetical protein